MIDYIVSYPKGTSKIVLIHICCVIVYSRPSLTLSSKTSLPDLISVCSGLGLILCFELNNIPDDLEIVNFTNFSLISMATFVISMIYLVFLNPIFTSVASVI